MRIFTSRLLTLWALAALGATAGCLVKDAPTPDAAATRDSSSDRAATDGPLAGSGGTGTGGSSGSGGTAGGTSDGPGASTDGTSGSDGVDARDVAPPDLVDAAGTCSVDGDCPVTTPMCVGNRCIRCTMTPECAGHAAVGKPVCDMASGRCEQCTPTEGCDKASTTPICGANKQCVRCEAPAAGGPSAPDAGMPSASCTGNAAGNFCAPAGNCVECLQTADCRDETKPICAANRCVPCTTDGQCMTRNAAAPACETGRCFECTADRFCSGVRPICNLTSHICARCTFDSQCVTKLGDNPGVCMSHQDGRCATDTETVYVANGLGCSTVPTTGGTSATPFCSPQDGIAAARGVKRLVLLRGSMPFVPWNASLDPGEISVISKDDATIDHGASIGIRLTRGQLYVRGVTVVAGSGPGVVAEAGSVLRLARCKILGSGGGLLINNAGFDIVNTIIAGNTEALVPPAGPTYGGVFLRSAVGAPTVFRYNTIVGNQNIGLQCAGPYATSSLIVANNIFMQSLGCVPTGAGIGVEPNLDVLQHLTPTSPCIDSGDSSQLPPGDDIDGDPRPATGAQSDCGADEFTQ